jgi:4-hydroxy-tetrahydrodipicolinate synthase
METRPVPLEGVVAGVVTPFHPDGSVNWEELRRQSELLSVSSLDALCVGGFAGQTEGMPSQEISTLCEVVSRYGKKPVVAIVYPDCHSEATELIQAVQSGGARAAFVAQPHYLCQPDSRGLADMFARLREQTLLPLLVCNCQRSAMIPVDTVALLAREKLIDGVLVGGDGVHHLVDLLCLHLRVPVFSAIEDLHYVSLLLGAQGIVSDLAAMFPEEMVSMHRAYRKEDYDRARTYHDRFVRLWRIFDHPSEQRARIRFALRWLGKDIGEPRSPYNINSPEAFHEIQTTLESEGLSPART